MQVQVAIELLRNRNVRTALLVAAFLVVSMPVLVAAAVVGLFAHEAEVSCEGAGAVGAVNTPAGGGPIAAGLYAAPLELRPGRWYEVGATAYGGPGDSAGDYGSIPNPGESYLPAHPDSFAELSLLDSNPANSGGALTFQDADALGNLAYLTELRVLHAGHEAILAKRDVGYGQGPGQLIGNGQPYRLDVWWQAARPLGISKSPVQVQLAPRTGAGATLEALPESSAAGGGAPLPPSACAAPEGAGSIPLPLTAGTQTKILPSGLAAAGGDAPGRVKAMVAAGNRLFAASYLYGGAHGTPLGHLEPAYDCSSAVSYVLHAGGVFGEYAEDSTELESYGEPGPGRYVSIYANAAHAFVYVGGLRFDTVEAPAYDSGPNSGKPGPRWRVSASVPGWATWTVRHPLGL
ncbi:MAG TPA: hypothetical protein VES97_08790 [Solirubrobacteraceae bacterium]|nr:hypothetical protein [Solirubrobacteraceae bacterium]